MLPKILRDQLRKELDVIPQTRERLLALAFGGTLIFLLMAFSEFVSQNNPCVKPKSVMCLMVGTISMVTGTPLETSNWLLYIIFAALLFIKGMKVYFKKS